jgi:hypothetical protein
MYEETVNEIVKYYSGGFVCDHVDLISALKAQLPDNTSIQSVVNFWDENGIYGTTSFSIFYMENEQTVHEHGLIVWFTFWEEFFEHIQDLCEGEVVSW